MSVWLMCVYVNKRERERAPELVLVRFICFALYTLFRPLKNPKHNSNLLCTLCLSIACLADFARCVCECFCVCVHVFISVPLYIELGCQSQAKRTAVLFLEY